MPTIEGLDPALQTIGTALFVIAVAVFAAWSTVFGRKSKAPEKELHINGQFSDMGPVKELVEGQGLLYQQQVRTNLVLERVAAALEKIGEPAAKYVEAKLEEIEDHEREEEIERRARIRAEDLMREQEADRDERRRPPARKP